MEGGGEGVEGVVCGGKESETQNFWEIADFLWGVFKLVLEHMLFQLPAVISWNWKNLISFQAQHTVR